MSGSSSFSLPVTSALHNIRIVFLSQSGSGLQAQTWQWPDLPNKYCDLLFSDLNQFNFTSVHLKQVRVFTAPVYRMGNCICAFCLSRGEPHV